MEEGPQGPGRARTITEPCGMRHTSSVTREKHISVISLSNHVSHVKLESTHSLSLSLTLPVCVCVCWSGVNIFMVLMMYWGGIRFLLDVDHDWVVQPLVASSDTRGLQWQKFTLYSFFRQLNCLNLLRLHYIFTVSVVQNRRNVPIWSCVALIMKLYYNTQFFAISLLQKPVQYTAPMCYHGPQVTDLSNVTFWPLA